MVVPEVGFARGNVVGEGTRCADERYNDADDI
jgi:hypothetical protein